MASSPKKFSIKPLLNLKKMDLLEAQKTFSIIEEGITQIYNKKDSNLSFEVHYR